jgi:hypothetical protein
MHLVASDCLVHTAEAATRTSFCLWSLALTLVGNATCIVSERVYVLHPPPRVAFCCLHMSEERRLLHTYLRRVLLNIFISSSSI